MMVLHFAMLDICRQECFGCIKLREAKEKVEKAALAPLRLMTRAEKIRSPWHEGKDDMKFSDIDDISVLSRSEGVHEYTLPKQCFLRVGSFIQECISSRRGSLKMTQGMFLKSGARWGPYQF